MKIPIPPKSDMTIKFHPNGIRLCSKKEAGNMPKPEDYIFVGKRDN